MPPEVPGIFIKIHYSRMQCRILGVSCVFMGNLMGNQNPKPRKMPESQSRLDPQATFGYFFASRQGLSRSMTHERTLLDSKK
jgi:hypothetical protein